MHVEMRAEWRGPRPGLGSSHSQQVVLFGAVRFSCLLGCWWQTDTLMTFQAQCCWLVQFCFQDYHLLVSDISSQRFRWRSAQTARPYLTHFPCVTKTLISFFFFFLFIPWLQLCNHFISLVMFMRKFSPVCFVPDCSSWCSRMPIGCHWS